MSRSFLYDDYMDEDVNERPSYGRSEMQPRNDYGIGRSAFQGGSSRSRGADFDLDDYSSVRRPTGGLSRREDPLEDFGRPVNSGPHARRFADAMGIPSNRAQRNYEDLEYAPVQRNRGVQQMVYRNAQPRPQVIRRIVGGRGRGDYLDDSRDEVVEIIERVRPQRRVQVVRKVPIHQRVVKKVIVKRTARLENRRNPSLGNNNLGGRIKRGPQQGRRTPSNGPQKKPAGARGGPKKDNKPKLTASELDRELDEYMKSSKHPRVAL